MADREDILKCYLHLAQLNIICRIRHDILLSAFGSIEAAALRSFVLYFTSPHIKAIHSKFNQGQYLHSGQALRGGWNY